MMTMICFLCFINWFNDHHAASQRLRKTLMHCIEVRSWSSTATSVWRQWNSSSNSVTKNKFQVRPDLAISHCFPKLSNYCLLFYNNNNNMLSPQFTSKRPTQLQPQNRFSRMPGKDFRLCLQISMSYNKSKMLFKVSFDVLRIAEYMKI